MVPMKPQCMRIHSRKRPPAAKLAAAARTFCCLLLDLLTLRGHKIWRLPYAAMLASTETAFLSAASADGIGTMLSAPLSVAGLRPD